VPPAYDVHPEFGYLCPGPRIRRELRVALVAVLCGMVIGAAIVTIRAGQAIETANLSSNVQLKSSDSDTLPLAAAAHTVPSGPEIVPASAPASPENAESPARQQFDRKRNHSQQLPSSRSAGARKRPSVMYARRHWNDENENGRWQNWRAPYWGERGYVNDQYWRGAHRNWVYR
jgi:hypothetical protein